MNEENSPAERSEGMQLTCGIDWSETRHDVALVDENAKVVARKKIDTGAAGFGELLALIAEHGGSPDNTPIAVETDKNLIVVALVDAGFTVNPRAVARYRERHGQSGRKSDPGDAAVLAHILRTDRTMHRPLPAASERGQTVKARSSASGGDLGLASERLPSAFGVAGVLSSSAASLSESATSHRDDNTRCCTNSSRGRGAYRATGDRPAETEWAGPSPGTG
ncbi:transposase [Nocardia sp. NPDC059239]|uniref:IS110 family transposase n=1 Tax=Nocardia sp. NPDC059239 TaxID=3346785 RepID=UPI0036BC563F